MCAALRSTAHPSTNDAPETMQGLAPVLSLLIIHIAWAIPTSVLLRRAGFSAWSHAILLFPLLGPFIAVWFAALVTWPKFKKQARRLE